MVVSVMALGTLIQFLALAGALPDVEYETGWIEVDSRGVYRGFQQSGGLPVPDEWVPVFHISRYSLGGLRHLPLPESHFAISFGFRARVDNSTLRELSKLERLTGLSISRANQITDEGLAELAPLKQLVSFDLLHSDLTDDGLKVLSHFPRLTSLGLVGNYLITDSGLKELAALKQLRVLDLAWTEVTDAGLKELVHMERLTELDLQGTRVTDSGLKELGTLNSLTLLTLRNTKVTERGVEELQKVLPKCRVKR